MRETWAVIWGTDLYRKLILTAIVLVGQGLLRRLLAWFVSSRLAPESPYVYPLRKASGYVVSFLSIFALIGLWVDRLGDLSVALGILAAGLAFALQEIIGSFAGWLTILGSRPLALGDRIETGGIRGDVIDIGVLRTTLMEIGNWLHGDHHTGRIVTVSNAFIFKEPLFNYSAHLRYIWDEITIPVPYEADWRKAIEIMVGTIKSSAPYQELLPKAVEQRRQARQRFAVKITPLAPRAFVYMTDNWIELGVVYPVDIDLRRAFRSEISQHILDAFATAGITVASQTIAIVQFPGGGAPQGA